MPKPERVYIPRESDGTVRERVKYTPAKAYRFLGEFTYDLNSLKNFEKTFEAPKTMDAAAAYVVLKDRRVSYGIDSEALQLLKKALACNEFPLPLYAIREKDLPKIAANPNWKPLDVVMTDLRATLLEKYKIRYVRAALASRCASLHVMERDMAKWLYTYKDSLHDGKLRKMLRRTARVYQSANNAVCQYLYYDKIEEIENKIEAQNVKLTEELKNRYKFLSHFRSYTSFADDEADIMVSLVNKCFEKSLAIN